MIVLRIIAAIQIRLVREVANQLRSGPPEAVLPFPNWVCKPVRDSRFGWFTVSQYIVYLPRYYGNAYLAFATIRLHHKLKCCGCLHLNDIRHLLTFIVRIRVQCTKYEQYKEIRTLFVYDWVSTCEQEHLLYIFTKWLSDKQRCYL